MLLVLDDVAATPNLNFKKQNFNSLNKLWSANRHLNISVVVICHKVKQAPPLLRGKADYSVISKVVTSALDDLWDEYGTSKNKQEFKKFIMNGTEGYNYLLFNSRSNEHNCFMNFCIPPEFADFKFALKF